MDFGLVLEFLSKISTLFPAISWSRVNVERVREKVTLGQGSDGMDGSRDSGGGNRHSNHGDDQNYDWHYWRSYCATWNTLSTFSYIFFSFTSPSKSRH